MPVRPREVATEKIGFAGRIVASWGYLAFGESTFFCGYFEAESGAGFWWFLGGESTSVNEFV